MLWILMDANTVLEGNHNRNQVVVSPILKDVHKGVIQDHITIARPYSCTKRIQKKETQIRQGNELTYCFIQMSV